tara:strand:- start:21097 stop:21282 length:186 start_codon:yes stop_codon:yes gene_type:complete
VSKSVHTARIAAFDWPGQYGFRYPIGSSEGGSKQKYQMDALILQQSALGNREIVKSNILII